MTTATEVLKGDDVASASGLFQSRPCEGTNVLKLQSSYLEALYLCECGYQQCSRIEFGSLGTCIQLKSPTLCLLFLFG